MLITVSDFFPHFSASHLLKIWSNFAHRPFVHLLCFFLLLQHPENKIKAIGWLGEQSTPMGCRSTHQGFCCNPRRRDTPINTRQRRGDPGLMLVISITRLQIPQCLWPYVWLDPGPGKWKKNPPYVQMAILAEGWGCGWQRCWCQDGGEGGGWV